MRQATCGEADCSLGGVLLFLWLWPQDPKDQLNNEIGSRAQIIFCFFIPLDRLALQACFDLFCQ
jgi:hypothetical protein